MSTWDNIVTQIEDSKGSTMGDIRPAPMRETRPARAPLMQHTPWQSLIYLSTVLTASQAHVNSVSIETITHTCLSTYALVHCPLPL